MVYALQLLGYDSYGVDISEYAISKAPKEVNGHVTCIEPLAELGFYDWIICKDILEHIPYEDIDSQLMMLRNSCKKMMVMVPLGDGEKYFIDAYEKDVTHVIRENLDWWINLFVSVGFKITKASYEMGPYKENWQIHPTGNGLFMLQI